MTLAPILPYITWGPIRDPQNKRGSPEKNINFFIIEENLKKIFNIYDKQNNK